MLGTVLLVVLILLLLGVFPAWPHSRRWGYGPSGVVGIVLLIVLILLPVGQIISAASLIDIANTMMCGVWRYNQMLSQHRPRR